MKKLAAAVSGIGYLLTTSVVMAQASSSIPVGIDTPQAGINPATSIGTILSNVLTIIFVVAALAVLFMLIWGAFQWITSGGEKEAVGKARGRIIAALVGLAVLALAFLITRVVGQLVNIDVLNLKNLPTLQQCQGSTVFNPRTGECVPPTAVPPAR